MVKRYKYTKNIDSIIGIVIGALVVIGVIYLIYYMGRESVTNRSSYNVDAASHLRIPDTGRIRLAMAHLYGDAPASQQQTEDVEKGILRRAGYIPHPTIEHQKKASAFTHPAHIGDAIRPGNPIHIGPIGKDYIMHPEGGFDRKLAYNVPKEGYNMGGGGVGVGSYPGKPLNVPVPRGSLKMTSEKYKYPFYKSSRPVSP